MATQRFLVNTATNSPTLNKKHSRPVTRQPIFAKPRPQRIPLQ
jgi:hypothetical protein